MTLNKMREILDDNSLLPKEEILKIKSGINRIESKNWYGIVLICIVIALIIITSLIEFSIFGFSQGLLIVNSLFIAIHLILLWLAQSDKLLAYSGGLIVFVGYFALGILLGNVFYLKSVLIALATIGSYLVFIFEEVELKKLKNKLKY